MVAERYAAKRSPYIVRVRGFGPDTVSQRPLQRSATCCSRPALVPAEVTNGPRTASLGRGANPSHPTSCATSDPPRGLAGVISPCVTFNVHAGSTKSYAFTREYEVELAEADFVPLRREITR